MTCTTSSCDRFCSSCFEVLLLLILTQREEESTPPTTHVESLAVDLEQRFSTYIVPSSGCGDNVAKSWNIFVSVFSVFGSGFRVGDGGRRRRRWRLQRKDRMYGFARQARRVPGVRTVPGERPARREQNPTSLLHRGRGSRDDVMRWSQQLLTTRRHTNNFRR